MTDFSQKERCDFCTKYKWVDFIAADSLWKSVMGDINVGVCCLNCFVEFANIHNVLIYPWEITVDIYNPVDPKGQLRYLRLHDGLLLYKQEEGDE